MGDTIEKLKADIQAKVPEGWEVFHAYPWPVRDQIDGLGDYKAQKRLDNGTLVVQHGDTPEQLVEATKGYDREQAKVVPTNPPVVTGPQATKTETETVPSRPLTEAEVVEQAVEVQPIALAEKVQTEGPDAVTDEEKAKAGLTPAGKPKAGTETTTKQSDAEKKAQSDAEKKAQSDAEKKGRGK